MTSAVVVDTSAVIAVVFGESDGDAFLDVMTTQAGFLSMSAASLVEILTVVEARLGADGSREVRLLLEELSVEVVAVDVEDAETAWSAWRRFGRGRHRAALNFGDCFSYALAKRLGGRLLYKGDDFTHTDISGVL